MKIRKFLVLPVALMFGLASLTACGSGEPNCGIGQVAEYDDDGWECETDSDNNGVEDEAEGGEDAESDGGFFDSDRKKHKTKKKSSNFGGSSKSKSRSKR